MYINILGGFYQRFLQFVYVAGKCPPPALARSASGSPFCKKGERAVLQTALRAGASSQSTYVENKFYLSFNANTNISLIKLYIISIKIY